jgi:hypothetical protein
MVHQASSQSIVDHLVIETVILELVDDVVKNSVVYGLDIAQCVVSLQMKTVFQPRMAPNLLNSDSFGWIFHQNLSRMKKQSYLIKSLNSAESFIESGNP